MYRSMMQVYVKDSGRALEFYQRAFDGKILCAYPNADGTLSHGELDVHGQTIALAELNGDGPDPGNTMQLCLHFGAGNEALVQKIYDGLKDGARILYPLGPIDFSPLLTDLVDQYGVRWCIFV